MFEPLTAAADKLARINNYFNFGAHVNVICFKLYFKLFNIILSQFTMTDKVYHTQIQDLFIYELLRRLLRITTRAYGTELVLHVKSTFYFRV